ncbi:MAG TPA: M56 family metallopeptidase [Rhizomicrobium sp.]|jgi:beta-lactamase regulating signal transducer with metallopeptidase domain|nr:M56 family metallopeptidase [Rhizomicrobium sp.]
MSALLDHLWQSTVFALGVYLVTLALRRNRAALRYGLWFAASVKFLLPFSLLIALASEVILPLTAPLITSPNAYVAQEAVQPFAVMASQFMPPAAAGPKGMMILAALWAAGFAFILGLWLLHSWRLSRTLASAADAPMAGPLPVKFSSSSLEPGLVGLWRPVLLLPEGIAARLSPAEMTAVMAHELCHHRRRDNLTAAVHMGVVALFWFYPLVWWIGTRLIEERERACDEDVVASGNDPNDYAAGIFKVCQFYRRSPLPCAAGISGTDLRKRIKAIVEGCGTLRLNSARKVLLVGSAAAVLAAPLLMGLSAPLMIRGNPLDLQTAFNLPASITSSPQYIEQTRPHKVIAFDPASFDKFVGYYRRGPRGITQVTRDGSHFYIRATLQSRYEIYPDAPNEFFSDVIYAQWRFESDAQGKITGFDLHQMGLVLHAPRMDDAEGRRLYTKLEQPLRDRIKSNMPSPGTEDWLRRYILALESGKPNYDAMPPVAAANLRKQYPFVQSRLKNWGAFKSIRFNHVGPYGQDFYDVHFANGYVEYWIKPLDRTGQPQGRPMVTELQFHFNGGLFD